MKTAGHMTKGIVNVLDTDANPLTATNIFNNLKPGYTPVPAVLILIELEVGNVRYVLRGGLAPFSSEREIDPVVIP